MNGAQGPKGDAGPQGDVGPKGDSYTLTTADKSEIAGEVVAGGVQAELGDEPVSLGITGATPGQIAKITAVDAQGKPTAWEPVDMANSLPSVTTADNGKFLRVVNGSWAAESVANAKGVSF